jgi:DNA repair exonuclease SbcCD nuclease subunit
MLKILATSDLHLGLTEVSGFIPHEARMSTFTRICGLAREHDVLLIAGDLFHSTDIPRALLETVAGSFKTLRDGGTSVLLVPGEGELSDTGSVSPLLYQLNASHVYTGTDETMVYTHSKGGDVIHFYGWPASGGNEVVTIKKRNDAGGMHMGIFHADFSLSDEERGQKVYMLQREDLKLLDLDFYILGHHHFFKLFKFHNRIIATYPGSPESTCPDETGDRYVLSITVDGNDIYQIKRLAINTFCVREIMLDCSRAASFAAITDILDKNKSPHTILRLSLEGERKFQVDRSVIDDFSKDYGALIVDDRSVPALQVLADELSRGGNLRAEFFTLLREKIAGGNVPRDIDRASLQQVLHAISRKGHYIPEDWSCA